MNSSILKALRNNSILVLALSTLLACSKDSEDATSSSGSSSAVTIDSTTTTSASPEGNTDTASDEDDLIANSTFSSQVLITFGSSVSITNPLSASGVTVTESNGDVEINSSVAEVEYVLSGTTTSGSVKIYSDKKFKLTLNGVDITNTDGPAINIQSSKRAFVVINDNTINTLTDGSSYTASTTDEDMKGTLFSEGQLIFSGDGSLSIKGNYKHAICSDDYVRIISGAITVSGATSDGIHTNEAFIADGGTVTITASNDGIQCEEGYIVMNAGTYTINSVDKGISASYDTDTSIDPYLTINGGTISVNSSAGEGIESKSTLTVNDGAITVKTYDDGLNASTAIYINGGKIYSYSSNNDGIDSNGILTVTGGISVSVGAGSPEEGFDCDQNTFKITGGILVGMGGATSTPTSSVTTQTAVILGSGTASQLFHIETTDGTEALTLLIPRSYTTMLFSSPKLSTGKTYSIYTGGSVSNTTEWNGLYLTGTYTPGTQSSTFTTSSIVTNVSGK
ncbi:MAG: carbohydrate-binding domain-containing protein [Siphonobacter sp.]